MAYPANPQSSLRSFHSSRRPPYRRPPLDPADQYVAKLDKALQPLFQQTTANPAPLSQEFWHTRIVEEAPNTRQGTARVCTTVELVNTMNKLSAMFTNPVSEKQMRLASPRGHDSTKEVEETLMIADLEGRLREVPHEAQESTQSALDDIIGSLDPAILNAPLPTSVPGQPDPSFAQLREERWFS